MEKTTFFEHFRILTRNDGSPLEVRRSGAAIHYKATDTRTGESVTLQLIPVAGVDDAKREQFLERARSIQKLDHINIARVLDVLSDKDHIGIVSEYVEGETTEAWLASHGPMPADAVLRIGLQVVRALAAATFHHLAHRAIQPSNIVIVPGQSADGGWPLVKLVNFGLSGLDIYSDGDALREMTSPGAPQFASPEQLVNRPVDFKSEIYSLGATMCFLITGAIPLAAPAMRVRLRVKRLPELRRAPRSLRNLLTRMLQEEPENRPQDPVAFETEMRDCLTTIEKREAVWRKIGIPLAAVVPRKPRTTEPTVFAQVIRGTVAFAALVVAAIVVAALFIPEDKVPFLHKKDDRIGVAVGVPENSAPIASPNAVNASPAASAVVQQAPATAAPATAMAANSPAPSASASPAIAEPPADTPPQVATVESRTMSEPPATGPSEESDQSDNDDASSTREAARSQSDSDSVKSDSKSSAEIASSSRATEQPPADSEPEASSSSTVKRSPPISSSRRSTSSRSRNAQIRPARRSGPLIQFPNGTPLHARVVRALPDGRVILRLPSGRTVLAVPEGSRWAPPRTHRRVIERAGPVDPDVPYQPFDPGD